MAENSFEQSHHPDACSITNPAYMTASGLSLLEAVVGDL